MSVALARNASILYCLYCTLLQASLAYCSSHSRRTPKNGPRDSTLSTTLQTFSIFARSDSASESKVMVLSPQRILSCEVFKPRIRTSNKTRGKSHANTQHRNNRPKMQSYPPSPNRHAADLVVPPLYCQLLLIYYSVLETFGSAVR